MMWNHKTLPHRIIHSGDHEEVHLFFFSNSLGRPDCPTDLSLPVPSEKSFAQFTSTETSVKKSEQTVYTFTMGVTNKRTTTKTRRKIRDVDQIQNDLASKKHLGDFQKTKAPEDLPGLGRHYCVECAKWFDTDATLVAHRRGKPHKRRYVSHNAYRLDVQPYNPAC
jgi:hypothetical protein